MRSRRPSARSRIVAWILFLVGSALAVPAYGITVVWERQLDDRVDEQLRREADKLRQFARTSRDPTTAQPFPDAASLLTAFLSANPPNQDETFFSIVDGRADRRSSHQPPTRLDRDEAVVARLARPRGTEMGRLDSPAGRVRYGVIPVRVAGDLRDARLVVLEFEDRQLRAERRVRTMLLTTGAAALLCAALVGWVVAGRILAPVRLVRQTAEQIGESDLTRRLKVSGHDDVAALAHTFNHMLDRLENAFTTQRRFLDDVAHELRTPITVIRGHLELMDDQEECRAETRALVVDELDRMSRIVGELLLLAKAERPDFLTVSETNLTDLVVDAVAKARALGERYWKVAAVCEATVLVDGQRLTQALIQLAANAVRHTQDGDPVEIGSAMTDGRVVLWVGDSGPGVRPEDRERIFERFTQAGRVVSPDPASPGIGLGLAIVREIAQAHGGTARVDDAIGGGARFVMDLPARHPAQRGHHEPDTHSGGRGPRRRLRRTGPAQAWLRHLRRR